MPEFLIIGEKLNSTDKKVKKLLEERDESALLDLARAQVDGGAKYLDLNASMLADKEEDALVWSLRCIKSELDIGISLDSPNMEILLRVMPLAGSEVIINSLTSDKGVLDEALPAVSEHESGVIVMLKNREGIPGTAQKRLQMAESAASSISAAGVSPEKVFIDPVLTPLATSPEGLGTALDTMAGLRKHFPDFRRIGGLSNISYGLPLRKLLNRTFISMAISYGLDAVICDPTDSKLMETVTASLAITGADRGCRDLLGYYRAKR